MNTLRRIPAVFAFEWRRALTIPRMGWMLALAALPPLLLFLIRMAARSDPPPDVAAVLVYVLSPCVACMMSVFLWSTPAVSSELEGRSWTYLSVRPHGTLAVLLGKYLVGVSWALPVGLLSAIIGSLVITQNDLPRLIATQCALATLSCVAYGAVFLLIGVIAPARAMVLGVIYAIVFEVAAAFIPAAINLLTIQHRLRCLLVRWMGMDMSIAEESPVLLAYFGEESAAWHVFLLIVMTAGYLVVAALLLRYREFTAAAETAT
jgi:ABC-type transport system involved in multi-copper enzyme maturation permease subunit